MPLDKCWLEGTVAVFCNIEAASRFNHNISISYLSKSNYNSCKIVSHNPPLAALIVAAMGTGEHITAALFC